jgi:hypothetical protein
MGAQFSSNAFFLRIVFLSTTNNKMSLSTAASGFSVLKQAVSPLQPLHKQGAAVATFLDRAAWSADDARALHGDLPLLCDAVFGRPRSAASGTGQQQQQPQQETLMSRYSRFISLPKMR